MQASTSATFHRLAIVVPLKSSVAGRGGRRQEQAFVFRDRSTIKRGDKYAGKGCVERCSHVRRGSRILTKEPNERLRMRRIDDHMAALLVGAVPAELARIGLDAAQRGSLGIWRRVALGRPARGVHQRRQA